LSFESVNKRFDQLWIPLCYFESFTLLAWTST